MVFDRRKMTDTEWAFYALSVVFRDVGRVIVDRARGRNLGRRAQRAQDRARGRWLTVNHRRP